MEVRPRLFMPFVLAGVLAMALAAPAAAQPQQNGLVNVNVDDVVIQVPVAVAANICGLDVNVLARDIRSGDADCDSTAESGTTIEWPGNGGNNGRQSGLINVNVSDIVVQLPIALAANVCAVSVNVLAEDVRSGDTDCDAVSVADAG